MRNRIGLSYTINNSGKTKKETSEYLNKGSYRAFEALMFAGLQSFLNPWRWNTLRLNKLYGGSGISNAIPRSRIPMSYMWSPSFVPKPSDWPEQCRVVGTYILKENEHSTVDENKFADLIQWIEDGDKPVFVGFGSMVVKDTVKLSTIIMEAAKIARCKIVVQSSWSKLDVSGEPLCFNVGPVAHDWLLPKCCAVIHHGGAGTTAAGLRYGLPTLVCPFFADQFMWAEMVHRAKVGPSPCPVNLLTSDILAEKLSELNDSQIRQNAMRLSEQMKKEDGISGGLQHFQDFFPRDNILCDVSIFLGETNIARYYDVTRNLKYSDEVASLLWWQPTSERHGNAIPRKALNVLRSLREAVVSIYNPKLKRHRVTTYALGRVLTFRRGIRSGLGGCMHVLITAPFQLCFVPDRLAREYGLIGCLLGLIVACPFMVLTVIYSFVILLDRILVGCVNGCCDGNKLFILDPRLKSEWGINEEDLARISKRKRDKAHILSPGLKFLHPAYEVNKVMLHMTLNSKRKEKLQGALNLASEARDMFHKARPHYPREHWHFEVVNIDALVTILKAPFVSEKASLKVDQRSSIASGLRDFMKSSGCSTVSFSMFCFIASKTMGLQQS